jgi:MinD superfamily P-loop ATPase
MMLMPAIDRNKCNGCGLCVAVCECKALAIVEGVIRVKPTVDCHWCTFCELVCPTGAIQCPFEIVSEER